MSQSWILKFLAFLEYKKYNIALHFNVKDQSFDYKLFNIGERMKFKI
jgi:hypothetical protein